MLDRPLAGVNGMDDPTEVSTLLGSDAILGT
jgi:hypothetical protein